MVSNLNTLLVVIIVIECEFCVGMSSLSVYSSAWESKVLHSHSHPWPPHLQLFPCFLYSWPGHTTPASNVTEHCFWHKAPSTVSLKYEHKSLDTIMVWPIISVQNWQIDPFNSQEILPPKLAATFSKEAKFILWFPESKPSSQDPKRVPVCLGTFQW